MESSDAHSFLKQKSKVLAKLSKQRFIQRVFFYSHWIRFHYNNLRCCPVVVVEIVDLHFILPSVIIAIENILVKKFAFFYCGESQSKLHAALLFCKSLNTYIKSFKKQAIWVKDLFRLLIFLEILFPESKNCNYLAFPLFFRKSFSIPCRNNFCKRKGDRSN